jgi:hypothetical protein
MIKGSKMTEAHRKKISESGKKSYENGRIPAWLGKTFSKEHKKKLSLSLTHRQEKPIEWYENENGCHICTSHKPRNGWYPQIKRGEKQEPIARYIYKQNKGEIPKGMIIRHTCDQPLCININHLLIGTHQDNMNDRNERNRTQKGEMNGSHKLTKQQAKEIFDSRENQHSLARHYNVHQSTISYIKSKKIWKHINEV